MEKKQIIKLVFVLIATIVAWVIPPECLGMPDLTIIEQRVISLFVFAALMWILEVIPIWTTSVLVIVMMLLLVSDSSFVFLQPEGFTTLLGQEKAGTISESDMTTLSQMKDSFGTFISHKSIMATFADPIIMLFMGGFALAIAATRTGLDLNLARVMLKPFGTRSEIVLLGFMIVTATFSMFMSNTATAAMMLAIVSPVLRQLPSEGKGRVALALAIPIAANVGGIGTPIGTPPNAIALRYITSAELGLNIDIGFGQWMLVMVPFVILIMAFSWLLLIKLYPFKQKHFEIKIEGEFKKDARSIIVYITFAVTVILWLLDKATGLNSNVVAMIPLAVFCITGIIGKEELKSINWDVLWLVAGGFALGVGLQGSGLAKHIIESIPFGEWSPLVVFAGSGLICYLMSTFMSHTASSALLVPILATVAKGMGDSITPYGGIVTMLVGVAVCSSLAMALPISTPPNALAHATGHTTQKDMATTGLIISFVGMVVGYFMLYGASCLGIM